MELLTFVFSKSSFLIGMTEQELTNQLNVLLSLPGETEVVEFKEANTSYDFRKLGKYFSALSNEANLGRKQQGWLIFGVNDNKQVIGTQYRPNRTNLDSLKNEIANKTNNRLTFIEIHELTYLNKRVVLFQIPAASLGMPTSFEGHFYGREGESLAPLSLAEIERIRMQVNQQDWSEKTIEEASLENLDPAAIKQARINYKVKFPEQAVEVDGWNDLTFLNKAKVTRRGKITNTAILLLGKDEATDFISPAVARIRWILKNDDNVPRDYAIYSCPFLLSAKAVFDKIRNLKYRYLKAGTLFPDEVDQYEPFIIREALNNCIAHQDYSKRGMINVVEMEDKLVFSNLGHFIPGSVERVIAEDAPEEDYRNPFLVRAMFNLGMVDTIGSGIIKIFRYQRERFFPMPDYELTDNRVKLTITGKVLDLDYSHILAKNDDLTLAEIILLDRVQKKQPISTEGAARLRKKKFIEGRKPNYYLSKQIAQVAGQKADYSKAKAFDKDYYIDLVLKSIAEHDFMERKDIDDLLWNKLPDILDEGQKKNKINNLISEMKRKGLIKNDGTRSNSKWHLK